MKLTVSWGQHEGEGDVRIQSFSRASRSKPDPDGGVLLRPLEIHLEGESAGPTCAAVVKGLLSLQPNEVLQIFTETLRTSGTSPEVQRLLRAALKETNLF